MKNFLGRNNFTWFLGVVEDRLDPAELGRVRVRCLGWHTEDTSQVSTGDLPWAVVMSPTTSASNSGVGQTHGIVEGTWVIGFFMDGERAQEPVIMGTIPGAPSSNSPTVGGFPRSEYFDQPDVNKLARGENTISYSADGDIGEPASPYNAQYPFNKVMETESGHVKEYDDTPNAERIREKHRSGTLYEVHPSGDKVVRVVGDNYEIVAGKNSVKVGGACKLIVVGSLDIQVGGACNIQSLGNMKLSAPRIDINPPGAGFGTPNPVLTDAPVPYVADIRPVTNMPEGYPSNSEQYEGPVEYAEVSPAICGETPHRNPYDVANEALSLGSSAWRETGSNPNITALWDEIGYNGANFADETAWCAVFVGAILKRSGNKYIQTASSQAYSNYGKEVNIADVQQGDIVVFYRNGPNSGLGHVGFATGAKTSTSIEVLGGNQSNNLNVKNFQLARYNSSGEQIWGLRTIRRAVSCEDGETEAPAAGTTATAATGTGGSVT
jgi:uncharacterized protein (TIGR02594 family)